MRSPASTALGALFGLLCAAAALAVWFVASQPYDYLVGHVVIDDAIYYVQPARQLFAGHGYSFDGVHRTNGVQPLWAMVVAALVGVLREPDLVVRAMVLLGGLLWIAAAVLLYRLLARQQAVGALLGAALFLLAGMESRVALQGMENGAHALLLVWVFHLARRWLLATADAARTRTLRWLGVAAALLALARVEYALFAALLGGWLLLAGERSAPWASRCRSLLPFAVPLLAIGGAWLIFSRAYFGEWTPISGSVKLWHHQNDPALGSFADRLGNAAHLVVLRTFAAALIGLFGWAFRALGRLATPTEIYATIGFAAALLLPAAPRLLRGLGGACWRSANGIAAAVALFLGAHLVMIAAWLSAFVGYCAWYLTGEMLGVCLLLGGLAGALRGVRLLLAAPLFAVLALAAAARIPTWFDAQPTWITAPYVQLGRFVERWLPAPATVGALGSGHIALAAPSHRVVNLDGLMNDGRFLRDYVRKRRVPDYFRDERIGYVADYLPGAPWRRHLRGELNTMPLPLRPIHCTPANGDWFTCVLATPYGDPGLPAALPHPLAAVRVQELLLAERPLLPDAARSSLPADQTIVSTFVVPPNDIVHLVVGRDRLASVVDAAGLPKLTTCDVPFGDRVSLCAVELPTDPVRAGDRCVVTTYWRALPGIDVGGPLAFWLEVAGRRFEGAPLHGTLPAGAWPVGVVLPHAFVVDVPAAAEAGAHEVRIGVLAADDAGTAPHAGFAAGPLRVVGR
jgi:hypothetical protein